MSSSPASRRVVGFGEFEVDTEARVLRRQGQRVPLQERPCKVLVLLIERADPAFADLHDHPRFVAWLARVRTDNARQLALLRSAPEGAPAVRARKSESEQGQ